MTLRTRLILLLLLATLPLIGVEIYSEIGIRAERQEEVSETATRLLEVVDAEQDRIDEGVHQLLVAFSQNPAIRSGDWAECNRTAGQIITTVAGYINLGVADLDGNIFCAYLPASPTTRFATRTNMMLSPSKGLMGRQVIIGSVSRLRGLPLSIPWRDRRAIHAARQCRRQWPDRNGWYRWHKAHHRLFAGIQ